MRLLGSHQKKLFAGQCAKSALFLVVSGRIKNFISR